MAAWHDNDDFWKGTAPAVFTAQRWAAAKTEVEQIVSLVGLQPGDAVLDMGCGPGRHSLEFARRGYQVTGVDRTAQYLAAAQDAARQEGLSAEWVESDMRRFSRENAFNAAVSLLTTFGYFENPADDRRVAENLLTSLKPGGHLVMELMGKEVLARIFRRYDWHEEPDGIIVLEERKVSKDWSWIDCRWIVIRGDERREHNFGHRLFSAGELKELLASVGFTDVKAYGSLKGTPYDREAERLVLVAKKSEQI